MKKPSEYHIELFVNSPEKLSRDERRWIQEWINKDDEVRLIADWYRQFFKQTEEIKKNKESNIEKPAVIYLKAIPNQLKNGNNFILAAQTATAKSKNKAIKTFVSEKHETLIRVIYDDKKTKIRFHAISQYLDDDDIVILSLEGDQSFYISKPGGVFEISDSVITKGKIADLDTCKIHLPLMKIDVFRDSNTGSITYFSSFTEKKGSSSILEITDREIKIDLESIPDKFKSERIILHSDGISSLWFIDENRCRIPLKKFKSTTSALYFYK